MIRIRNRAMARMPGAGRKRSGFQSGVLFSVLASSAAVLAGITGTGYVTVLAADNVEQNQEMAGGDSLRLTGGGTSGNIDNVNIPDSQADDTGQVYDFKDNKTTGTVTVTKVWDDGLTNDEREIPDIKISTKKPSKSALGYTVTFHGDAENGLLFDNGSDVNEVVIGSSGQIVSGNYKIAGGVLFAGWYSDGKYTNRVEVSNDGIPQITLTGDLNLWAKKKTFEIKGYGYSLYKGNGFNKSIPSTVTEVIFTDEIKPAATEIIDVDADSDGGVIAWTENDSTVMKVSTQIRGIEVQAAVNSSSMFYKKSKIKKIDLKMLDTSKVTDMSSMFYNCTGLTSLDLTPLDTSKVTDMSAMFFGCSGLTSLDLSPLDTQNVTDMSGLFFKCISLKKINCSKFNATNVKSARCMFAGCTSVEGILLPTFSEKLTYIYSNNYDDGYSGLFECCHKLKTIDLTPLKTSNVTNMNCMFSGCTSLINLDLTPLNTSNVTEMYCMFAYCSNLENIESILLNTKNVKSMSFMFADCIKLKNLKLSNFDTSYEWYVFVLLFIKTDRLLKF